MRAKHAYIIYELFYHFGLSFTFTSYVPYLRSLGLSPSDVSLVNFGFWMALLVCELPTGIFADRFGRARSIQIGAVVSAIAALLYSTANGVWTATIYEMLIGVGLSFISGALSAWVREAMEDAGEQAEYATVVARTAQYRYLISIAGGLLGGWMSTQSFRLVWIFAGSFILLSAVIAKYFMHDPISRKPVSKVRLAPLTQSWHRLRGHPELRWAVLTYLVFSFVLPFNHYWAPYFRTRLGERDQILLWIPMYLGMWGGAYLARHCSVTPRHHATALCMSLFVSGAGLALLPYTSFTSSALLMLVLHEMGRGFYFPMLEVFTQSRIENEYRATYSSLQSLLARVGHLLVLAGVWIYTADLPWNNDLIGRVWTISGLVLVMFILLLWIRKP